jgi:glutamate N-acetyltransferase/amino-acid N-acetyltransferase
MAGGTSAVSPLAPAAFPEMPELGGVRFATAEAGIKYQNRRDVLLMLFDKGTTVAGVFTRSKCPSAAVDWCKAAIKGGKARVLLVNSGNANAFTGKRGRQAVKLSAEMAAGVAGCGQRDVFLASTGVIGEPLDARKFDGVLIDAAERARPGPWNDAARAIMTTDTYPKGASRSVRLGDATVTINGIAKGAGMIAPDMATMLSFVVTDAPIAAPVLHTLLSKGVTDTFNAITVDSDTSTSDTLLMFATGAAKDAPRISNPADPRLRPFRAALNDLLRDLAHQVVRDGEGARKFVEIRVSGAVSKKSARRIAMAIANSPLVKTAIAGEDANWGRIVMAVGKAGEPAERDRLTISFGNVRVAARGERDPHYSEAAASAEMKREHIVIAVDIGLGKGSDTVWTCDLTKEYVAINGDYRS